MKFAGIDLAWSGRRPSGFAVIEGSRCTAWTATFAPADVADWLDGLGADVVACVDAPLQVSPTRSADAALGRALGRFGVTAYTTGQGFLDRHGIAGGPELGRILEHRGWSLRPLDGPTSSGRHAFETYPRALILVLLGTHPVPRYKTGRLDDRAAAIAALEQRLEAAFSVRGLHLESPGRAAAHATRCATGRALKDREDCFDAALCALAAWELARGALDPADWFGEAGEGLIVVPGASRVTSARAPTSP